MACISSVRSITSAHRTRVWPRPVARPHRQWLLASPIIAGVSENCCRITYRRLVGHHPSNVGVPRMRSNALLSGGAETTVSCGATYGATCGDNQSLQAFLPLPRGDFAENGT